MDYLARTLEYFCDRRGRAPRRSLPTRNRIDADTKIICYHDTLRGPKPATQKTDFLPLRTRVLATPFSDIIRSQAEVGYEEIDTVPAAALGLSSEFSAGHWYVVHPVTYWQVREMNDKVLLDLKTWIADTYPNEMFTRKAAHVLLFKKVRAETVAEICKELESREKNGGVGKEPGYTGDWELVDTENEIDEDVAAGEGGETEEQETSRPLPIPRHSNAGLEMAREAGWRAAEDARDQQEWDFADE